MRKPVKGGTYDQSYEPFFKTRIFKTFKDSVSESIPEKEDGNMLDEGEKMSGLNRKYLITVLSAKTDLEHKSTRQRKARCETYDKRFVVVLKKIWEILDYPCGARLKPMLPEMVNKLVEYGELTIPDQMKQKLLRVCASTINTKLKHSRQQIRRRIQGTTKPGSLLKSQIPIRTSSWEESHPGFCELDTVAHCGASAAGEFANTLNVTDILTTWTEQEAFLGKAQSRIVSGLNLIEGRMPFPLRGIDPDNGSEFINWQLYNHCLANNIEFTRGRPYAKNDNAHIEQKNYTHVRKLIGYRRLDKDHQMKKINDLYWNEWDFYKNFFLPNKKLIEKRRVGAKIVKKYDKPKTPYQRLLEHKDFPESEKEKLKAVYAKLNPAELKRSIDKKLSKI